MTGTNLYVNKCKQSRSYLNHLVHKEANVRTFNSLNNCLQDVLDLTPTINLITLFYILNILILNSPPIPPPPNSIPSLFEVRLFFCNTNLRYLLGKIQTHVHIPPFT